MNAENKFGRFVDIEGHPGWKRDMRSNAIVRSKSEDGNVARAAKKKKKQMENDINKLKNEIGEIKNLLKILVDKNGT